MTLVQGQDPIGAETTGKDDDQCVREADAQIPIPLDNRGHLGHVPEAEVIRVHLALWRSASLS